MLIKIPSSVGKLPLPRLFSYFEEGEAKEDMEKQVEEKSMTVGLRRKDALFRSKWSVSINKIAAVLR